MWRVRFRFRSGRPPGLRVGATGWLVWPERPPSNRESLVVLSSAVLRSAGGPRLLVSSPDRRTFRSQPIVTGRLLAGYTVVVSGAAERELAVGLDPFALDAEVQLQAQRHAAGEELEP
jgi:hypothetical protein